MTDMSEQVSVVRSLQRVAGNLPYCSSDELHKLVAGLSTQSVSKLKGLLDRGDYASQTKVRGWLCGCVCI